MANPSGSYTIGQIAQQAGLRPSALRYYESVGILPVPGRVSGQRLYDADIFRHIRFIQAAQKAGFSLEEIKTLLDISPGSRPYAERLQELARRKLVDVQRLIADAQAMQQVLQAGLDCRCDGPEDCLLFVPETSSPVRAGRSAPEPNTARRRAKFG